MAVDTISSTITGLGSVRTVRMFTNSIAYAGSIDSTGVRVVDINTGAITPISGFNDVRGMAFVGTKAVIGSGADGKVMILDTGTNTITKTFTGFSYPWGIAATATKAYVCGYGNVYPITPATETLGPAINFGGAAGICIDNTTAFVAGYSTGFGVIDTNSDTLSGSYTTPGSWSMYTAATASSVYISNYLGASVSVFNRASGTFGSNMTGFSSPAELVIANNKLYVCNYGANTVWVINPATNTLITSITGLSSPWGIATTPDQSKVIVANSGNASLSIIETGAVAAPTSVANGFFEMF